MNADAHTHELRVVGALQGLEIRYGDQVEEVTPPLFSFRRLRYGLRSRYVHCADLLTPADVERAARRAIRNHDRESANAGKRTGYKDLIAAANLPVLRDAEGVWGHEVAAGTAQLPEPPAKPDDFYLPKWDEIAEMNWRRAIRTTVSEPVRRYMARPYFECDPANGFHLPGCIHARTPREIPVVPNA